MKKFAVLAFALVLTAGLMTACRWNASVDTTGPSQTNAPQSTAPTTKPTTAPTTPSTTPTQPSENTPSNGGTIDGNGDAGKKSNGGAVLS
ncbi:MAG: hypothetical protein E7462_04550 [Ruminococcaceae bacterium]|nr:hypothetical protein [Oscillospiraceae bacterium]